MMGWVGLQMGPPSQSTGPINWTHMMEGKMDRVWYTDVIFFFRAAVQTGANQVVQRDFAFLQWFTSYGSALDPTGGQCRHVAQGFPAILNR